jgi:hypothetical protein
MVVVTVDVTHSYANAVSLLEVVGEVVLLVDDDVELDDVEELLCSVVEDAVELEAFELVAEEEEVEVAVDEVEDAEVVDFPLEIAMYATPPAATIITITTMAKTVGAIPRLLLTSKLVMHSPQGKKYHVINYPNALG